MIGFIAQNLTVHRRSIFVAGLLAAVCCWLIVGRVKTSRAQNPPRPFKNFESPQVHPLALTPDGTRLLAVNSPENRLSVFHLAGSVPQLIAEIPVGLEPVSVIAPNDSEAWVVNWLSDSVSVVNLSTFNVTRTIDIGDEPTDILFAGSPKVFAFVCVSGANQVKVIDPDNAAAIPQSISIFGMRPRSLACDASGARVFVSVFESGNRSTIVPAAQVSQGGGPPPPSPAMSGTLPPAPATGLIVKWNGTNWVDERNDGKWTQFLPYTLADNDVITIDAGSQSPGLNLNIRGVGTLIGNGIFDNSGNRLFVVNTEAHNEVRFEPNIKGRFMSTRVSTIAFGGGPPSVSAIDLNPHINYSNATGSDQERANSLAIPADIVRAANGTMYVAATGSAKVGVLDGNGNIHALVNVGQGPTGLAFDQLRNRLYVLNRFDESLGVVDAGTNLQTTSISIGFNPEPSSVRSGRRPLYDGTLSAHGDLACASCHANGHRDGLAWDLGNPQGAMQQVNGGVATSTFHPMKGPMTTQSLRGIIGTEPLHWRGDRANLSAFNPAFMSLQGSPRQLTSPEMAAFEDFIRTLTYGPNPNENLDRTLPNPATGPNATRGSQLFNTARLDGNALTCNQCHTASPGFGTGTNKLIIPGMALQESQDFKVPQLRALYQKAGLQRVAGEQITGYGFIHDGSFDSILNFLRAPVFTFANDNDRRDVEQFVLSFDTGVAPAVGLQQTVTNGTRNLQSVTDRINLLMSQAALANCDLVVQGRFGGVRRGFGYIGGNFFQTDRQAEPNVSLQTLLQTFDATSGLTFTGVLPGTGHRLGVDRDENGVFNGDESKLPNAIDEAQFFVGAHYLDFLTRIPDPSGLAFWTRQISDCGSDARCIEVKRINVSAAYFLSIEFQQTGYLVERIYKGAYGDAIGTSTLGGSHQLAVPIVRLNEFLPDTRRIGNGVIVGQTGWEQLLETNTQAFTTEFVQRSRFITAFPTSMTPAQFVDKLFLNAGVLPSASDRTVAINEFNSATMTSEVAARARALRRVAENSIFSQQESNRAFVLMQFLGYLRRNPNDAPDADYSGYEFWLTKLNQFNGNYAEAEMVKAFIVSGEYRQRFGP